MNNYKPLGFQPMKLEDVSPKNCIHEYEERPNPNDYLPHTVCRKCKHVKSPFDEIKALKSKTK